MISQRYERLRREAGFLREAPAAGNSELALQARIFGGEFGTAWRGEDGEAIEIIHFGKWNREPGPDFTGAVALIDGVEHRGDIEVDPAAADWERHGHSLNPAFENVIIHLFFRRESRRFFTRTANRRAVVQVRVGAELAPAARRRNSGRDLLPSGQARELVEAAAAFRLRTRRAAFENAERLCGRREAIFQGMAAGLGFKNNKIPFLLVAQRAGLARAGGPAGEALLFGLAGFLSAEDFDAADDEARDYLRRLWERWWTMRDRENRLVLPSKAWAFFGTRPANHPHRRMGALAAVAKEAGSILPFFESGDLPGLIARLSGLDHNYWRRHFRLGSSSLPTELALIGEDRALDLAINVLLPARPFDEAWAALKTLRGPPPSRKILTAAAALCADRPRDLCASALGQQGLLQIAGDFPSVEPLELWDRFARDWTRRGLVRENA